MNCRSPSSTCGREVDEGRAPPELCRRGLTTTSGSATRRMCPNAEAVHSSGGSTSPTAGLYNRPRGARIDSGRLRSRRTYVPSRSRPRVSKPGHIFNRSGLQLTKTRFANGVEMIGSTYDPRGIKLSPPTVLFRALHGVNGGEKPEILRTRSATTRSTWSGTRCRTHQNGPRAVLACGSRAPAPFASGPLPTSSIVI